MASYDRTLKKNFKIFVAGPSGCGKKILPVILYRTGLLFQDKPSAPSFIAGISGSQNMMK